MWLRDETQHEALLHEISGYLLRDIVNKIDEIHFTSNEELNSLSHLYESILKEMRDASGDAGEFYTPPQL